MPSSTRSDFSELDKLQRMDHDTLIRLESKVDSLIQIARENMNKTIALEIRVNSLEQSRDEINPEKLLQQTEENRQWIHDFKMTWRTILGVSIVVSTFIGWGINQITSLIVGGVLFHK